MLELQSKRGKSAHERERLGRPSHPTVPLLYFRPRDLVGEAAGRPRHACLSPERLRVSMWGGDQYWGPERRKKVWSH